MQTPFMRTPAYRRNALFISILLGSIFIFCLAFLFISSRSRKEGELTALVYQDGTLVYTIPLNEVAESYTLLLTGKEGNYNLLEVRSGSIGIIDASCPDKLCVHMGFQESTLLPITCLPNNVVIRLEKHTADNKTPALDGISY